MVSTCKICKVSFEKETGLKLHYKQLHKKDNLFICNECPKTFARFANLYYHTLSHEKNPPLPVFCPVCQVPFEQESELDQHVLHNHSQSYESLGFKEEENSLDGTLLKYVMNLENEDIYTMLQLSQSSAVFNKLKELLEVKILGK